MTHEELPYHSNALLAQTNTHGNGIKNWSNIGGQQISDAVAQESNSLLNFINPNTNLMNLHEQVNGLSGK